MISVRAYIDSYAENPPDVPSHYDVLKNAGYIPIRINGNRWGPIFDWLQENIGWENYNSTGNTFWFNSEQDAVLFALKWS